MKRINLRRVAVGAFWLLAFAPAVFSQAVIVTMGLDAPSISVGQTTTLRVFAQVAPSLRDTADRIFSWYVDVSNSNGAVAVANYAAMVKAASDNDPVLSSNGTADGTHRRGIYDFFFNRAGAGVSAPVELMSMPVSGQTAGSTRFVVSAGTGVSGFGADFLVLPMDDGPPASGGDYSAAFVDLVVSGAGGCEPELHLVPMAGGGGPGGTFQLTFTPCPGRTHTVEFRASLEAGSEWTALPGAPHNSGSVVVANSAGSGFYRVRMSQP
jgi:hypothetical protein